MTYTGREIYQDRVRLYHTDAFGVLYWGSALDWAQRGVETILERAGHPIEAALDTQIDYPVRQAEIEFLAPLTLGLPVTVETTLVAVGETSARFETRVVADERVSLVVRQTLVAFDRRSAQAVPVEPWMRALVAP